MKLQAQKVNSQTFCCAESRAFLQKIVKEEEDIMDQQ